MDWLTLEMHGLLRLVIALVCGAAVGLDRERGHRPAGLRTHTLVCMGACLVMYLAFWALERYGYSGDPMRMGAQVISGIGFLGAGTIIKAGRDVRGLTTAACLWIVACIGLAIGAGYYIGGVVTTILVLVTLSLFKLVEARFEPNVFELYVRAHNEPTAARTIINQLLAWGVQVSRLSAEQNGDQLMVTLVVHLPATFKRTTFISQLLSIPVINSVSDQPM